MVWDSIKDAIANGIYKGCIYLLWVIFWGNLFHQIYKWRYGG